MFAAVQAITRAYINREIRNPTHMQDSAKVSSQWLVHKTELILILLFVNYWVTFHTSSCSPTLPLHVHIYMCSAHYVLCLSFSNEHSFLLQFLEQICLIDISDISIYILYELNSFISFYNLKNSQIACTDRQLSFS